MASGTGIGEFFVSLTVDAAEGALTVNNLVQGFGHLEIATVAEISLLWELGTMLARVTDAGVKASLGFEQFTMHTGLSAQELQKWQIVAQQSHASAEAVAGSAENLTKHLANLAVGIPDSSLASLQQLGISAFDAGGKLKTAFQIFGEIRTRLGFVTQDAAQQERLLAGLGISADLRETFLLSQALFNQRGSLVPGMSAAQEEQFNLLRQNIVEIELKSKQIGINIGAWVSPELTKWLIWVQEVAKEISGLFQSKGVQSLAGPLGRQASAQYNIVGDLLNLLAGRGLDVADLGKNYRKFTGASDELGLGLFSSLSALALPQIPPMLERPAVNVTVNKNDVYHIHDATDPQKVGRVVDEKNQAWTNWFDQQIVGAF